MQRQLRTHTETSSNLEGNCQSIAGLFCSESHHAHNAGVVELKEKELAELAEVAHNMQAALDKRKADLNHANKLIAQTKSVFFVFAKPTGGGKRRTHGRLCCCRIQLAEAQLQAEEARDALREEKAVVCEHEKTQESLKRRIAAHVDQLDAAQATINKLHEKIERNRQNGKNRNASFGAKKKKIRLKTDVVLCRQMCAIPKKRNSLET